MRFGVTVKLASGLRLQADGRGIRAAFGPRAPRTDPGIGQPGCAADAGTTSYDTADDSEGAQEPSPFGPTRPTLAQLHSKERAPDKAERMQQVLDAERFLTTRHLVDFPANQPAIAEPPQPLDTDRIEQAFRRQAMADVGWFNRAGRRAARELAHSAAVAVADEQYATAADEAERLQAAYYAHWKALTAHDRDTVVAAVDDALAGIAPESTCVDAGIDQGSGRYVSCVVTFGHPDLVPDRVVAPALTGRPALKKRSRSDINDLYVTALASIVLATVREALAVATAAAEVRIVVVRPTPLTATAPDDAIRLIYAGRFVRAKLDGLDWQTIDLESELLRADGAEFVRRGAARTVVPLDVDAHRRMAGVLRAFAAPVYEAGDAID